MSIFQILLIVSLVLIFTALALICGIILYYVKLNKEKNLILSHRELWKDYINDKDLVGVGLLSNNNGRGGVL